MLWDNNDAEASTAQAILALGVRPAWAVHVTDQFDTEDVGPATGGVGSALVNVSSLANGQDATQRDDRGKREADAEDDAGENGGASAQALKSPPADARSARGTAALSSRHAIFDSVNRVVNGHLNGQDPSQRYAVTVDALGRVVLLDTCGLRLLRIWKGYRDAQTAWLTCPESWTDQEDDTCNEASAREGEPSVDCGAEGGDERNGQYLVILAPWRETVQIWRVPGCVLVSSMRLPSCAVGAVHLLTHVDWASRQARCFLVRDGTSAREEDEDDEEEEEEVEERVCGLNVQEVLTTRASLERLMTHLNKGKNQQAGFMAHQFRHALGSARFRQAETIFGETKQADVIWRLLLAMDTDLTGVLIPPAKFHLRMIAHAQAVLGEMKQDAACERLLRQLEVRVRLVRLHASLAVSTPENVAADLRELDVDASLVPCATEDLSIWTAGGTNAGKPRQPICIRELLHVFGALVLRDMDDLCWTDPANVQVDERKCNWADRGGTSGTDEVINESAGENEVSSESSELPDLTPSHQLSLETQQSIAALLFDPILIDVFMLSKVTSAMAHFDGSSQVYLQLFLDWWFQLPLERVLDTASNAPSAVIRLLGELLKGAEAHVEIIIKYAQESRHVCHGLILVRLCARAAEEAAKTELTKAARELEDVLVICCCARRSDLSCMDFGVQTAKFAQVVARALVEERDVSAIEDRFTAQCKLGSDLIQGHRALLYCDEHGANLDAALESLRSIQDVRMRRGLVVRVRELAILPLVRNEALVSEKRCDVALAILNELEGSDDVKKEEERNVKGGATVLDEGAEELGFPWLDKVFREEMRDAQASIVPQRVAEDRLALLALKGLVRVMEGGAEGAGSRLKLLAQLFAGNKIPLEKALTLQIKKDESTPEADEIASRRTRLVQRVVQANVDEPAFAFELARALGVPVDKVHIELAHRLYARGDDAAGKASADRVKDQGALALVLLSVARQRMASVLQVLQDLPQYRHLLAVISADTSKWIRAGGVVPPHRGGGGTEEADTTSAAAVGKQRANLSSTLVLLHEIASNLPASSPAQRRATQMATAADALFRRVQDAIR
ncbi:Rab3 GTPase-activating protein non-catalytic subunit [Hondaea fermentalgiana]|uniref:Rab3 GTPase-activating protein non-catalytic subunit n=1 Tax=Hondaea fermentalgiana TaxID=2315210 RepID=A0A2R5G8V0_9STRA|nr:Rab3 GTPase-activating protein non-catalytic subunit [Hondaea fermentalgiana]|eukprot:GBG27482.1 Rab3 GTPase-activating protein non-catalytic subunit [Hondaea fermentalgiana]